MSALIGKYFIGVFEDAMRSGTIEAAIEPELCLVRFDTFIGFTDGSKWPEYLVLVPLSMMIDHPEAEDEAPPAWKFFDSQGQRERYQAWLEEPPIDARAQIVSIRRDDK